MGDLRECPSCLGTGKVFHVVGIDEDSYPLYKKMLCPFCHGAKMVDLNELYVVPRAMVKPEFFVNKEYTEDSQAYLRRILQREKEFFENIK